MRTIQVSTETFAALWKAQRSGEASEEEILRRILGVADIPVVNRPDRDSSVAPEGFRDPRYGVVLPEGFEIFRTYRGVEFKARATQGAWRLATTGSDYGTLNELSGALGIANENAWANWFFAEKGERKPLSALRDPGKIVRRGRAK